MLFFFMVRAHSDFCYIKLEGMFNNPPYCEQEIKKKSYAHEIELEELKIYISKCKKKICLHFRVKSKLIMSFQYYTVKSFYHSYVYRYQY